MLPAPCVILAAFHSLQELQKILTHFIPVRKFSKQLYSLSHLLPQLRPVN